MVDGGGLFWRSSRLPDSQREAVSLKASLVAENLSSTGIDAIGLTPADLSLGWERVQQLASEHSLPYLAANFDCGGEEPFPATRVVERSGVKLGFVGAYLGTVPTTAEGCTAGDAVPAVQAALPELEGVDAIVVLGAWDAKEAQSLVEAVPQVDFIVTAANLTLPEGRPLTLDDWMLGSGSRGKKIGLLKGTLVPGAEGWQGASPGAALADRLDSYRKRLQSNQDRLEEAKDDRARTRAERQVAFYQKEITRLEAELEAATAPREKPANSFENALESLGKTVDSHAETLAKVEALNKLLEEKGLVNKKATPAKVELPAGLSGLRRLEAGPGGGPPMPPQIDIKGAPLHEPAAEAPPKAPAKQ